MAGIAEDMSIDSCLHSVFGASKVAADVMVQEYGRYFDMPTACFRGGTLTGPNHAAAELHGFLAYVVRCAMVGRTYRVFGYKGKQVRDAIHSRDLIAAFDVINAIRKWRRSTTSVAGASRTAPCWRPSSWRPPPISAELRHPRSPVEAVKSGDQIATVNRVAHLLAL